MQSVLGVSTPPCSPFRTNEREKTGKPLFTAAVYIFTAEKTSRGKVELLFVFLSIFRFYIEAKPNRESCWKVRCVFTHTCRRDSAGV